MRKEFRELSKLEQLEPLLIVKEEPKKEDLEDFFWLEPMTKLYTFFEVVPEQIQGIKQFYPHLIVILDGHNY